MANISARGAVDLGALATARQNQKKAEEALAGAPAGIVVDVTVESFQAEVIDRSMTVPVVIDLWAEWCGPCKQLSPVLERLAAEYAGRWVLAKVDIDAEQQIGAAFKVQSIPAVFAVIKGQPVPMFQGALPEAQVRQILDELLKVAAEQGVSGVVGEAGAPADAPMDGDADDARADEAPLDPRFEAAYEAIEAGDWSGAAAAYRTVLAADPGDVDAQAGIALVGLYSRTDGIEESSISSLDEDAAALLTADFAAMRQEWPAAFAAAIGVVRRTSGEEREAARARVLDYFLLAADDPSVPAARSSLASALF